MAETKFTPGPWLFKDGFITANGKPLKVVGVQIPMVVGASRIEAIWNSRLIAAAPDLAAALTDMLAGWRYIREHHGDLYGVGWDRCEKAAVAALESVTASPKGGDTPHER